MELNQADVMTLQGEQVTLGPQQTADYSAAIERQYAYERGQAADFDTGRGGLPLSAVPFITGAAFSSVFSFGTGGPGGPSSPLTRLYAGETPGPWRFDPQTNFPPESIYREPPRNTLPVPYEPIPPIVPFIGSGIIGGIIGGIAGGLWTGWPNAIGNDDYATPPPIMPPGGSLHPEDIPQGPIPDTVYGPPHDDVPPVGLPPYRPSPPGPDGLSPIDVEAIMLPGGMPSIGQRDAQGRERTRQGRMLPNPVWPTPAPAPPVPVQARSAAVAPWIWALGGTGIAGVLRQFRHRGRDPLSAGALTSIEDALLSSVATTSSAPRFETATASAASFEDPCDCHSKKRGRKRKCLARAQLSWRSGPKKGKAAGSRCIRFAD